MLNDVVGRNLVVVSTGIVVTVEDRGFSCPRAFSGDYNDLRIAVAVVEAMTRLSR